MNREDYPEPDPVELRRPPAELAELLRLAPISELEPIPEYAWGAYRSAKAA